MRNFLAVLFGLLVLSSGAWAQPATVLTPGVTTTTRPNTNAQVVVERPDCTTLSNCPPGQQAQIWIAGGGTVQAFVTTTSLGGSWVFCRAENAENGTLATNGQTVGFACDFTGRLINFPFANKENILTGSANTTGTGATTLKAAQGAGVKIYIVSAQCKNSGASASVVTLNDSASTVLFCPAGSGDNSVFSLPLSVAANTALTFTPGSASTTIYVNFQGFAGS